MAVEVIERQKITISADRPLSDPKLDRLGYTPFAKHLTEAILRIESPNGLVIALYGSWGSGKSTVLNFVKHYLDKNPKSVECKLIDFNPWLFSGHEALTKQFFEQMLAQLGDPDDPDIQDIADKVQDFSSAISSIPIPYIHHAKSVGKIISYVLGLSKKPKDAHKLKEQIEKALDAYDKKIVVVIDDIDRLVDEEICSLFRLIKSVANFKKITYLLAFDREVVEKAVESLQKSPGRNYLEKIIQIPFELPIAQKETLRKMMFTHLGVILGEIDPKLADQSYIENMYLEGVEPFLSKPRDVIRLINTITVTYPLVAGEVNPIDFVVIETIRTFIPELYNVIRYNQNYFARSLSSMRDETNEKQFHESWVESMDESKREIIKELMKRLFPKLKSIWGNTTYGSDWEGEWRRQLRVCSPEVFPNYFTLVISDDQVLLSEIKAAIKATESMDSFSDLLKIYSNKFTADSQTKVRILLSRLEDHVKDDIPEENISNAIKGLMNACDVIIASDKGMKGVFDLGVDTQIARILRQLMRRLTSENRFRAFKEALEMPASLTVGVDEVISFSREHGRLGSKEQEPESERMFSLANIEELEKIALNKIQVAAKDMTLLKSKRVLRLLWDWSRLGDSEEVKKWLLTVINKPDLLLKLLANSLSFSFSQSIDDLVMRKHPRLNPKDFSPFVDLTIMAQEVQKLKSLELGEDEQSAVFQFLKEYGLLVSGRDPSRDLD